MKEIVLANDRGVALVDDSDYDYLSQFSWCINHSKYSKTSYALAYFKTEDGRRSSRYMHSLIMNPDPGLEVDHKDRNGLNNQRSNLRVGTRQQNMWNRCKIAGNYKGVHFHKERSKWGARITANGVLYLLGEDYEDEIVAALVYDAAAKVLHGEFAVLNFPSCHPPGY